MPLSASCAGKDIRQGITGNGDQGHTSVRKHDTTKKSSTRKKYSLLYDIIAKKKKKRTRKRTEKRKKRSKTIRQYLQQNDLHDETPTEEESDDDTTGSERITDADTLMLDESNEAYLRAQNGFPIEGITCRGGDNVVINDLRSTFRFLSNNINGFVMKNEGGELLEELTVLKELQASAACFQETNKNWKRVGVYGAVKKVFSNVWRKNKLVTSSSGERTSTAYQPGGTASAVFDKWVSQVCASGSDSLGRWSYLTLKGKQSRKITIISAYRVCVNSLDQAGSATCWKQQWRQLKKRGHTDPDPRKIFVKDFSAFIGSRIEQEEELIIGMDANDDNQDQSDLRRLLRQNDLVDVFEHLHAGVTPPHTYQRGDKRIDYVFITPALIPALRSTGFLPFNLPFTSDHGAAYVDFDEETLFMGKTTNPVDSARRNLISGNPAGRENYCEDLKTQFAKHYIVDKVDTLYNTIKSNNYDISDITARYETIDRQITEMMLSAERNCRTPTTGKAWSIKLVQAARQVRYWKTRQSDKLNDRNPSPYLLQLGTDLNIAHDKLSLPSISKRLTKARKNLSQVQKNAADIRDEMLEEMALQQTTNNNSEVATIIKNIRHREEVKTSFRIMKPIAKGSTGGTVSYIKEPIPITSPSIYPASFTALGYEPAYQAVYNDDEVMSKLLRRNKLHLNQAWDTPCAQGPLRDYIGDNGLGVGSKDILDGNFDPNRSENLPAVNHWLKHNIRRVATENSINVDISLDNYKSLMRVQDESTSSSPSGRHYGHYKAVLGHDDICTVHARMMSMPWLAGFTPSRWERAIDCMLEKDPGNPKIGRLRLIVIVEGDMNGTLKIIWNHRLVPTAEKTNFLSPVQFGNRKGRTALDALLMKIVTMDCIRLFRLNGAILNNDAAACYDRMIPALTAVHLKALGFPDNATRTSVLLNQRAKHHIKTTAGVTDAYYQSTPDCPSFGEGQGKGSSPSNWLFTVSTLLAALHQLCSGIKLFSVCRKKHASRVADAYVDDTGNTYVDIEKQSSETPESIRDKLQHTAQTWEQLLFGSGGRLCHKKTFWWLIWWVWKDGKAKMATKSDVDTAMRIKFGRDTTTTTIKRKNCNEVAKDLGVLVNPEGDFCPEFERREKISIQVTQRLKRTSLSAKNAYRLYHNIWLPSMQYPLAVTSFSKEQCVRIMKPFVHAILPKLGFNRHTARTIIFGSTRYGGFQLAHLYLEQGYLAIKHFLGHVREETLTGDQIVIALSKVQLVAGSGNHYLEEVKSDRSYVPASWLGNIRTFLRCSKASIIVPGAWKPATQRDFDSILMDVFESLKPSSCTLEKLNAVRLFLRVITLADITDESGRSIEAWALSGSTVATICIDWPHQAKPPDSYWVIWRRFLKKAFAPATPRSHRLNTPIRLAQPLGKWTTRHPYTARKYYHDPTGNQILMHDQGTFHCYSQCHNRVVWFQATGESLQQLPDEAVITTALKFGSLLVCRAHIQRMQAQAQQQTALATTSLPSFAEYIGIQPPHIQRLLGNLHTDNINPDYWIQAITEGTVTIATDGSVAKRKGYFAVVFHTDESTIRFQGPCDGNDALMTSYRTELTGILSALYLLQALIKFTGTTPPAVPPLFCDNISAVKRTNAATLPGVKEHVSPDFDLIHEIRSTKHNLPEFTATWVKAHQDDGTALEDLPLDSQLNVMADADVNSFRINPPHRLRPSTTPTIFPSLHAYLTVNGLTVTSKFQQILRDNYTGTDIFEHVRTKTQLRIEDMNKIDWDNLGIAYERQRLFTKVRLVKFMHNWLNTGYQKKKIDQAAVDDCPVCGAQEETWQHMFQCNHADSIAIRTLAITKFKSKLISLGTAPILRETLCYKIAQWCNMPTLQAPRIPDDDVGEVIGDAVEDQQIIGWDNFMKGRMCIRWKMAQEMFKLALPTCNGYDRERWASTVITEIWSIFRHIWNARNAHLHSEMEESHFSTLDKQVRNAFSLQHSMFESDQLLFHMSLADRLQTSHEAKALWLQSVSIAIHDFTVVHERTPCQPTITSFFHPIDGSAPTSSITNNTVPSPAEDDIEYMPALI
jgi:hypothetical protein